jgi:hypothetical protein
VGILWVEFAAKDGNTRALSVDKATEREHALGFVVVKAGQKLGKFAESLLLGQQTDKLRHLIECMTPDVLIRRSVGRL